MAVNVELGAAYLETDRVEQALTVLEAPGEQSVVHGRAAHVLLDRGVSDSILLRSKEFRALGEGTARTLRVLETIVERWC